MRTQWLLGKWVGLLVIIAFTLPGVSQWSEFPSTMEIHARLSRPGSVCNSETPVLLTTTSQITHLTADEQTLYWLTRGNPGTVMTMSKRNGKVQVLAEIKSEPNGILVDHASVFWVEQTWQPDNSYALRRVDKKRLDKWGRKTTELWQAPGWMGYLNMDERNLYWLDYDSNAVLRMSKKGSEPKTFVSGLENLDNFAILNRKVYIGGHLGLAILERPRQMPRLLITSDQLFRDLHIGLRDERSLYSVGPVIAEYKNEIIFVFSVANYPGIGSCTDNADHIVALPKAGGKPRILLTVTGSLAYGSLVDSAIIAPYLYSVGKCQGAQMTNLETGIASPINIGQDVSDLVVDKKYIYWANSYSDGLKCMRRPSE